MTKKSMKIIDYKYHIFKFEHPSEMLFLKAKYKFWRQTIRNRKLSSKITKWKSSPKLQYQIRYRNQLHPIIRQKLANFLGKILLTHKKILNYPIQLHKLSLLDTDLIDEETKRKYLSQAYSTVQGQTGTQPE